jgi:hypothetical protein
MPSARETEGIVAAPWQAGQRVNPLEGGRSTSMTLSITVRILGGSDASRSGEHLLSVLGFWLTFRGTSTLSNG